MKILYISHHLKGNDGWSRYARDLIALTKEKGVEVLCLVNEIDTLTDIPQVACLKKDPSAYLVSPIISYFDSKKVNKIIKDFKPDIIHFLVEPYGIIIPFIKKGNSKIVITVHSTFAYIPILLKGFRRIFAQYIALKSYKKIDSIISVSKYTEEHLKKHMDSIGGLKYIENKLNIISGGVVSDSVDATARELLSNNPKEILFVGALKPRKGLLESIMALSKVKTDFIYRIVGNFNENNSYVKLIRNKIKELNLDKKVVLVGSVSDEVLKSMYKKADLFLMLSTNNGADFEGYGLVYIEANGRGVPVIGPNDSGVSDAIVSGKTGYIVNQFDSASVAKTIDYFFENKTIKTEDCIFWARENTSEIKTNKVFEVYKKLL